MLEGLRDGTGIVASVGTYRMITVTSLRSNAIKT